MVCGDTPKQVASCSIRFIHTLPVVYNCVSFTCRSVRDTVSTASASTNLVCLTSSFYVLDHEYLGYPSPTVIRHPP